jgi:NAD(P)-dependent dehydrogenase (short-subunit alcohol dehydrogenase family)
MEGKILIGKVALATGGSRGIGAAISGKLAALGAQVAINFRSDAESARRVANEIQRGGGSAQIFAGDVADPAAVKAMVARWRKPWAVSISCSITPDRSARVRSARSTQHSSPNNSTPTP